MWCALLCLVCLVLHFSSLLPCMLYCVLCILHAFTRTHTIFALFCLGWHACCIPLSLLFPCPHLLLCYLPVPTSHHSYLSLSSFLLPYLPPSFSAGGGVACLECLPCMQTFVAFCRPRCLPHLCLLLYVCTCRSWRAALPAMRSAAAWHALALAAGWRHLPPPSPSDRSLSRFHIFHRRKIIRNHSSQIHLRSISKTFLLDSPFLVYSF